MKSLEHNLSRMGPWLAFAIFAFVTMAMYSTSINNDFLAGDEETIMLKNVFLRDWEFVPKFFTENYKAGSGENSNYYRPVQLLLAFGIVQTTGMVPWPFHIVSLLFHAGCAFFFFRLLRDFFSPKIPVTLMFLGALVWVAHPSHNEEMALASGVASSTHLFFMLAGMYAFLRFLRSGQALTFVLALLANAAAVLSKESAIVFPGLLLGTHLILQNLDHVPKESLKRMLKLHGPFWALTLGYVALRLTVLNFDNTLNFYKTQSPFTESFMVRLYTFATVIFQQITAFFYPVGLHPEREWPVFTKFLQANVLAGSATILAMLSAAVYFWKRSPMISFGVCWFLGCYIPMSNLFAKINAIIWDHWLYTPSMGLIILVLWALTKVPPALARVALALPFLFLSGMTFARNEIWSDTESLSRFILHHEPQSVKTMTNLAIALAAKGNNQEAIQYYKKAIEMQDVWPQAHHNLAIQYAQMNDFETAKIELKKAIDMQGDFYYSMTLLGAILYHQGQIEEALNWYEKSLKIYPQQPQVADILRRHRRIAD